SGAAMWRGPAAGGTSWQRYSDGWPTRPARAMSSAMTETPGRAPKIVTAAMLVIGNEILSGRTRDANTHFLAGKLTEIGIRLMEARVVPDNEATIIAAVNELRARYDHVFTSGGIGPTHDDITADCIAKAFGVAIGVQPEARRRLEAHYEAGMLY